MPAACRPAILCLLFVAAPSAAIAQMPAEPAAMSAQSCTAAVTPSGALAPWAAPVALQAAADAGHLAAARITIGQAAQVALLPTPQVRFALRPEKPGGSVSYGGMARLRIDRAGTYRIALGSPAWLDLVSAGKPAISNAHGHGPACTGIHKMVDFPLAPGDYTLQVSANGAPQTTILVVRLP